MPGKKQSLATILRIVGGLLIVGACLVGLTIWLLSLADEPGPKPETPDIKPPPDLTPRPGKKWD